MSSLLLVLSAFSAVFLGFRLISCLRQCYKPSKPEDDCSTTNNRGE